MPSLVRSSLQLVHRRRLGFEVLPPPGLGEFGDTRAWLGLGLRSELGRRCRGYGSPPPHSLLVPPACAPPIFPLHPTLGWRIAPCVPRLNACTPPNFFLSFTPPSPFSFLFLFLPLPVGWAANLGGSRLGCHSAAAADSTGLHSTPRERPSVPVPAPVPVPVALLFSSWDLLLRILLLGCG